MRRFILFQIFTQVIFLSAFLVCALPTAVIAQQHESYAPQFFVSLQDVPLMPGLTELTELTVVFDKPEGRIIESVAQIKSLSSDSVRAYYEASLPQLGWNRIGEDSFARQGEYLRMNFEIADGQSFLKITVMPHG